MTTAGKERAVVVDAAYIVTSIVNPSIDIAAGYEDIMPSGKGRYNDEQLREMSDVIGTLK